MMTIRFIDNDNGNPAGKMADAELHFHSGPLSGLKLIGFAVWERRAGGGFNVTFPARQYSVNGERRSFALLRPADDASAQEQLRDVIVRAYVEHKHKALDAMPPTMTLTPDGLVPAPAGAAAGSSAPAARRKGGRK